MKKNGFLFVESIACITMLLAVLVALYASFSNSFREEDKRIYYDDITYIYRTMDIRDYLKKEELLDDISEISFNKIPSINDESHLHWAKKDYHLTSLYYIVGNSILKEVKKDTDESIDNNDDKDYIKTINPEDDKPILVAKYITSKSGNAPTNQTFKECMRDSSKKKNDCLIVTYYSWVYA